MLTYSIKGISYNSETENFAIDSRGLDEIGLLKVALDCIVLAQDAVIMAALTKNYFTEGCQLYLDVLRAVSSDIREKTK